MEAKRHLKLSLQKLALSKKVGKSPKFEGGSRGIAEEAISTTPSMPGVAAVLVSSSRKQKRKKRKQTTERVSSGQERVRPPSQDQSERKSKPQIGDAVEVRDEGESEWRKGVVVTSDDIGADLKVRCFGFKGAYVWDHVRFPQRVPRDDSAMERRRSESDNRGKSGEVKDKPDGEKPLMHMSRKPSSRLEIL